MVNGAGWTTVAAPKPPDTLGSAPGSPAVRDAYRPAHHFSAAILAFYIFLVFSRVLDLSSLAFLHIPLIMWVVLVVTTLARGDLKNAFSSRLSWFLAALTGWVLVCFPFSVWRAASVSSVLLSLQSFAIYLAVVQLVRTPADWRRVAGGYAYAVLVASVLSFYLGRVVEGRISLVSGSLADPNEFALTLAIGLPFWWFKASRAGALRKPLFWLCTVPILVSFARAGSRSGLVALGVLLLVVILYASVTQKILIMVIAVVGTVAASALLPGYLKARFMTIFSPHDVQQLDDKSRQQLGADIDSSQGREMLLLQSIQMTFEHPIFGVGPGVFAQASWDERKSLGMKAGLAQVSHNTYTQVSSEIGIPGFIFLLATVFLSFKYTLSDYRATRRAHSDLASNGLYMLASMSALAAGIFFLSLGYTYTLAVMFGLATSLHHIVKKSLADSANTNTPERSLPFHPNMAKSPAMTRPLLAPDDSPGVMPSRVEPRRRRRQRNPRAKSRL